MRGFHFSLGTLFLAMLEPGAADVVLAQQAPGPEQDRDLAVVAPAEAEAVPKFRVEIVLFAHNTLDPGEELLVGSAPPAAATPLGRRPEDPSFASTGVPLAGAVEGAAPAPALWLDWLSPGELALSAAYNRLENLKPYRPLLHVGWVQEGLPEEQAPALDLSQLGVPSLAGSVRLHLSRYLHVTAAIDYYTASAAQAGSERPRYGDGLAAPSVRPHYEMRESRRMRTDEVNYFDHPAFGLLVMVTRQPEPETGAVAREAGAAPVAPDGAEAQTAAVAP